MLSKRSSKLRKAISRGATIAIVVIVIIVIIGGAYAALKLAPSTTSTSSTSTSTNTSTTSSSSVPCNIGQCTTTTTATSSTGSITPPANTNTSQLVDESPTGPYDSLDPAYGFFTVDGFFANVFQGLVAYNGSSSLQVVPSLASSWTVSANFENYSFTMRPNTHFSNMDPVNAYVAWFSFVRELYWGAPTTVGISNYADITVNTTTDIVDGNIMPHGLAAAIDSVAHSTLSENALVSNLNYMLSNFNPSNTTQLAIMTYPHQAYVAVNTSTFQVNLIQPYSQFLLVLPAQWGAIQDPVYIDANGGVQNNTGPSTSKVAADFNSNGMPGTGPYEYGPNPAANPSVLVLNANPNYWGKGVSGLPAAVQPPHIATIIMKFGLLPNTVIADFDSGASQLAAPPIAQFGQAWSGYDLNSKVSFSQVVHNLGAPLCDLAQGMNTQFGLTNITLLREAIVHAVNYSQIQQQLYTYNGQSFAELFIPPVPPGWGPLDNPANIPLYSFNITLAAQLVAEAGTQNHFYVTLGNGTNVGDTSGSLLPAINYDYIVPLTPELTTQIGIVQAGLANIGVRITPTGITTGEYDAALSTPNNGVPIVGVGWCADWADPIYQQFLDMATTIAHQPNWVNNATLNTLLSEIPFETNATLQMQQTIEAYNIFTQLATIIQIPNSVIYYWEQPYVTGLTYSPFQFAVLYNYLQYT